MPDHTDGAAMADPSNQKPRGGYDQWLMDQLIIIGERIASLETKIDTEIKHLATKNDVSKSKLWVILTAIGGMVSISLLIFTILRYLDPT